MAKFKIRVIIKAEVEYEVEVEARDEFEAEDKATGMWAEMTPSDFEVNKGYITDWDVDNNERLTYVCEECEREYPAEPQTINLQNGAEGPYPLMPWYEDCDFCAECGPKIQAEEDAKEAARVQRRIYAAILASEAAQKAGTR